jgi:hypothetical protein
MVKGNNPLWVSFYNGGQVRQGSGGAPDPDVVMTMKATGIKIAVTESISVK